MKHNISFYLKYLTAFLWIIVLCVLIAATLIEKNNGTEYVQKEIYSSATFVGVWGIFALVSCIYMLRRKLYARPITFMLHVSFIVILAGAFLTWGWAERGTMRLAPNQTLDQFTDKEGNDYSLPFEVTLESFNLEYYRGTSMPMDFISKVQIQENGVATHRKGTISMNHILSYRGYRFYQSGYDEEHSVLTVTHDPWGIGVTYTGYALLFLTSLAFFFSKRSRFHSLLQRVSAGRLALLAVLFMSGLHIHAEKSTQNQPMPKVLPTEVAAHFCDLYIYYNDRICPMQTFARDFTLKLCGKDSYHGLTAEQVLTGWIFYYDSWKEEPIFKIKSSAARKLMQMDQKFGTLQNFFDKYNQLCLDESLQQIRQGEEVPDARGLQEANEKFVIVSQIATGAAIKIFPYRTKDQKGLIWFAQVDHLPKDLSHGEWVFMRKVLDYVNEKVLMEQWSEVNELVDKIKTYQEKNGGELLPEPAKFKAEKTYNRLEYSTPAVIVIIVLGILYYLCKLYTLLRQRKPQRQMSIACDVLTAGLWIYLTVIMGLRAYVSGHLPLSNGYETMQLLAWCTLLFTFVFRNKYGMVRPFGLLITGFALLVSILSFSNPQITSLMPVLASPLLSIHVMVIMIAYALLAFIMLNGLTALGVYRFQGKDYANLQTIHDISELLLYPAIFLLGIGIFIGAIWANVSWGRYWGWDPKETWALITFLIYALALHKDSFTWFKKPMFFHLFCVIAFLSVLITYFGVNYLLGGMHSYA